MSRSYGFIVVTTLTVLGLLSAAGKVQAAEEALAVKFNGTAGGNQTSPVSEDAGKFAATGSFALGKHQALNAVVIRYRKQGAGEWTVVNAKTDDTLKTWSVTVPNLVKDTYEVTMRIEATFTDPGTGSKSGVERACDETRTVKVK
jgi:hypothetical protein